MADWISLTLSALKATETSTNRAALAEWAQSEGMPASANNPLAATDVLPGSTTINSKGVQAYASIGDAATLYARKFGTLTYDAIGFALKAGNDLNEIFTACTGIAFFGGVGTLSGFALPTSTLAPVTLKPSIVSTSATMSTCIVESSSLRSVADSLESDWTWAAVIFCVAAVCRSLSRFTRSASSALVIMIRRPTPAHARSASARVSHALNA